MMQGYAFHQQGMLKEAQEYYLKVLKREPGHLEALQVFLSLAGQSGDYILALGLLESARIVRPNDTLIHNDLGKVLCELGRFDDALNSYAKAIECNPHHAEAFFNQGNVFYQQGRLDAALSSYDSAIELEPSDPLPFFNQGNVFYQLGQLDAALSSYDSAIKLEPNLVGAWINRGSILSELQFFREALMSFDQALSHEPENSQGLLNKGVVLNKLRRFDEALFYFDEAILVRPDFAEAWSNQAISYQELRQFDKAISSYERAIELKPDIEYLIGNLVYTKLQIANWDNLENDIELVVNSIRSNKNAVFPFAFLGMVDSPDLQLKAAQLWVKDEYPKSLMRPKIINKRDQKIRLGYFSADYYNHATAYLMAEFFELHNKEKFEIFAFSFGPDIQDKSRKRLQNVFDEFIDVSDISDRDIAKLSRDRGIDIAIDLKGYTKNYRTGIFANRAAPIQVNYLGYPGSMGAEFIDYIIADQILIPQHKQSFYREKVAYLPNCYQVNDSKRLISEKIFSRIDLGLPEEGFVFCCFNNNYKITPIVFDSWARILRSINGSVLWLLEDSNIAKKNLIKEAQIRGIAKERLIFAERLELPEHLARHRLADLMLDTTPYNAHTTASDALWSGLPVLTLIGNSFAGRVAASLLTAVGLPELITSSRQEYEAVAIELATHPTKLIEIKQRLKENIFVKPLFNTPLVTSQVEEIYLKMYERYRQGLPPENILI
jgi:predicted O-linked N-acetylglucosamine transferase (SPINDLY family)